MEDLQNQEVVNYREEILRLVSEGKIKHTTKYVEKASHETLEKIYKSYIAKQLDETNEPIANALFTQISELLTSLELVEDENDLHDDLENNELLKGDVKNILWYITPYVPWIGLACGAICIGKHVLKNRRENKKKKKNNFRNAINVTKNF